MVYVLKFQENSATTSFRIWAQTQTPKSLGQTIRPTYVAQKFTEFKIKIIVQSAQITQLHGTKIAKQLTSNFYQISGKVTYKIFENPRLFTKKSVNLCRKFKPRSQFENFTYLLFATGFGDIKGKLCPIKVNEILFQILSIFGRFFKVGQGYGTLPSGLEITGKYIPQFAPTENFLCVFALYLL
jgi:hypothetical protein